MKEQHSSNKLKLICSFNGEFRRRITDGKLRYHGGETKIISVDPTSLTFSKLRSLITTQLVRVTNFKLRYLLPSSELGDSPLVLLESDDDVLCMVEEFKNNNSNNNNDNSRLWVFVFEGNYEYPDENSLEIRDLNEGFRVLRENSLGFKVGSFDASFNNNNNNNHVFKKYLDDNNKNFNNHRKKKMSNEKDGCLRKLVLKQQLLLARKREKFGNVVDCSLGGGDVEVYDQPLIDLGSELWENSSAMRKSLMCSGNLVNDGDGDDGVGGAGGDCGGVLSTLELNCCTLESRKGNPNVGCVMGGCSDGLNGGGRSVCKEYLNRENIMTCSLDGNVLNTLVSCGDRVIGRGSVMNYLHRGQGMSSHCGIRSHQFGLSDVRNQGVGVSCHKGSHCVGKLGDKVMVGARCYPGLGVSKVGHAMRIHHPNLLSRPLYGSHRSKAVEMRKLIDHNKANTRKQDNEVSVNQSQVHRCVGIDSPQTLEKPLIDLNEDTNGVHYEDKYIETAIKYEPYHDGANVNAPYMVAKNVMTYAANSDLMGNGLTDSIDISSYNPSMSSSKVATPALSDVRSEVSAPLQMDQLKVLEPTVEAKQLPEREGLNKDVLPSIIGIMDIWEKSCSLQEEMQDVPSVSPNIDELADSRENQKHSNKIDGIPIDVAAFYAHLATRGLQTIQESDLEYIKELGSGNYGTVYHGKWKGSDVAIKKIKPSCFNGDAKEEDRLVTDFWKEAHILGTLHHPNIVAFYGVVTDGPITNLATVTEYMINGSLKQVLQRKDRTIDRRKRLIIAMDAAFGMEYLHEKNIVHFDLKSHNFLVNMRDPQRPVCKIGDLGLSKIKQRTMVSGGIRGTIPWMAPELLNTSTNLVTEKVDVYSFGIVMWELLTGEEPYAGMRSGDIIAGIIKGTLRPEIPNWCDPAWGSLMESCWSSDPKSRPSFSEIAKELRAISATMNIK